MRPDRIIVGECRGPETLDMLQAMNTGHEGSMTTIHANSSREALSRLEVLVLMAGFDLPIRAIREQIAGSIDIIVHLDRTPKGVRSVASISEVHGLESDVIVMQDLFRRGPHGERGAAPLEPTGLRPKITELLAERGAPLDAATFRPDSMDLERQERNRQRPSRFRLDAVGYAPKGR
jgi:pilus assembly protein CpaF